MSRVGYAAVLLLCLIATVFATVVLDENYAASAGPLRVVDSYWGNEATQITAAPGDMSIPLNVVVQNSSNATVTGLTQVLALPHHFTNMSGGRLASAFYAGNIPPGQTGTTRFLLNIARNASIGEYTLQMKVDYLEIASGVGKTIYLAKKTEVFVPILVSGTTLVTIYSVNLAPRQVPSPGNVTISGNVVNTAASSLSNTNVSIASAAFVSGTFIFIGQIDPNIPRPFSTTLQVRRGLPNGTFPVEIRAVYTDTLGVVHVASTTAFLRIGQRELTQPQQRTERSFVDIMVDVLRRILRFFFGFSIAISGAESWS